MDAELLTDAQRGAMWMLVGRLAKTPLGRSGAEEQLRTFVEEVSGSSSTKGLTVEQADQVIDLLRSCLRRWVDTPEPASAGGVSSAQRRLLDLLFAQAGMGDATRRKGFCQRQIKRDTPADTAEAEKVIEGLKAIILRARPAAELTALAQRLQGHTRLNDWQRGFLEDLCRRLARGGRVWTSHRIAKLLEAEAACAEASCGPT